jgi:hypothetical protein
MKLIQTQRSISKRSRKAKVSPEAKLKHQEFLKAMGYDSSKLDRGPKLLESLFSTDDKYIHSNTTNTIPGNCYKRSIDDYKWKRGVAETKETAQEIEAKAKRIAPLYNKGAAQYITPETDLKSLGKKV